jgi:23S rRNA pseudouridine2605 synthase
VVAPPGCRPVGRQMREIRRFDGDAREVVSRWAAGGEAPATVNGPGGGGGRGGRKGARGRGGGRGGNNGAAGRGGANAKVHEGAPKRVNRVSVARRPRRKPPGAADEKQPPDGNGNGDAKADAREAEKNDAPDRPPRPRIRRSGRSASAVPAPGVQGGGGPRRGGRGGGRSAAVAPWGIGASFGSAGRSKALPPRGWGAVAATLRAFA